MRIADYLIGSKRLHGDFVTLELIDAEGERVGNLKLKIGRQHAAVMANAEAVEIKTGVAQTASAEILEREGARRREVDSILARTPPLPS